MHPARSASPFLSTHWSCVLALRDAGADTEARALSDLCKAYWFPLYAFARQRGYSPHDAEDAVQSFFADTGHARCFQKAGGGRKSPDGRIERVKIGGNCLGTSIVASTVSTGEAQTRRYDTSADQFVGKADTTTPSRIGEIIVHGRIATGSGKMKLAQILDGSGNAFMAQEIGTLQINGKTIPTKGGVKTALDARRKTRIKTQR